MQITRDSASRGALAVAVVLLATLGVATAQEPAGPQPVDRWVIEFDSGTFALVSRSETSKILPDTDELPAVQVPPSGFWFELQAEDGSVLYRRIISDPVLLVFEGPQLEDDEMPTLARAEKSARPVPAPGRGGGRMVEVRQGGSGGAVRANMERATTAPPIRDEAVPQQRVFTLLTPAASGGDSLVLFSSPLELNSQAEPATEIARFTVEPDVPQ